MAKLKLKRLRNVEQTGAEMERLVRTYSCDVADLDNLNIFKMFRYVANLKYIADPMGIELVQRPKFVRSKKARFRDCDDKSILLGAWLYRRKIPFRFIAVSTKPNKKLHHVLIECRFKNGSKKYLDATYPQNKIFQHKPFTNRQYISGWIKQGA
jgi:hypothetical protein